MGNFLIFNHFRQQTHFQSAPLPIIRNAPSVEKEVNGDSGLNEFIKNGVPKEAIPDRIFIAIYDGTQYMMGWGGLKTNQSQVSDYVYPYFYTSLYCSVRRDDLVSFECQRAFKYGDERRM